MSSLEAFWQMHADMVALAERFERALKEIERQKAAKAAGALTRVEYDRERLDAPPTPKQGSILPAPLCRCGDPAKRVEKEGRNGKPYVAYACPNPKSEGCDFWVFENQLKQAG